jgi:hypothetical protein
MYSFAFAWGSVKHARISSCNSKVASARQTARTSPPRGVSIG